MPGLLTHNLMPEDRADEMPTTTPERSARAGGASASAPPAMAAGQTAVACSVHKEVAFSDGSLRCERCFSIRYPQGRLF